MKRDNGCKGCSWNFGRPDFPCIYCEGHDLYIDFPYHKSEDEAIRKMVIGMISATIYLVLGIIAGLDISEIVKEVDKNNGKISR